MCDKTVSLESTPTQARTESIQLVIGGTTESDLLCDCEVVGELRFHHLRHNFVRSNNSNEASLRKHITSCDIWSYRRGKS